MKKNSFLKQFTVGLMIGLMALMGYSASVTYTTTAATTNSMVSGAGTITQLTMTSTSSTNFNVWLYDAPALTLTNMTAKYTNYVPTVFTNTISNYTDILGNVITNTYYYITNLPTTVGGSAGVTNVYRLIGTYVVPGNTTVTIPYSVVNPFVFGVLASNFLSGSVTLTYQPWR